MVFMAIIMGQIGRIEISELRSKKYQHVISEMALFLSLMIAVFVLRSKI